MSAGHQPKSHLSYGVTAPASQTNFPLANLSIDNEMRLNLVVDCYLGQVAGTPSLKLQDSTGYSFWNDVKATTLSASTDKTATVSGTTWTSASHGFTNGQMVVVNSTGNLPGGYLPGMRCFVEGATTDTFALTPSNSTRSAPIAATDSGTGTLTVTAVTLVTLRLNVNVAGDQSVMPMRPMGRMVTTTGGSDTVQLMDVRTGYTY